MVYMSMTLCRSNLKLRKTCEEKEIRAVQINAERNYFQLLTFLSKEHPRKMMGLLNVKNPKCQEVIFSSP